jgi:hypothetical protein
MAIGLLTLAALGTLGLLATVLLGYRVPGAAVTLKTHFMAALLSTTVLVAAHSFIMFFLIATGVEMKEKEKAAGRGDSFRRRTIALKSRIFPLLTGALLLVIVNFILGAAAHTRALPAWVHEATAWATLLVSLAAFARAYGVLGDNNRLIAEAATLREDTPRAGRDPDAPTSH